MAQWLYSSRGHPIAFIYESTKVFSRRGAFIGYLEGNEVWDGTYQGEIVEDDMLLKKHGKGGVNKGRRGTPGSPGVGGVPGSRGMSGLPSGYADLEE